MEKSLHVCVGEGNINPNIGKTSMSSPRSSPVVVVGLSKILG